MYFNNHLLHSSYKPIVEYIDAQFEAYLQEELKIKRSLFNPMDCSLPGSSIHGIFQAGVLEWVIIAFSGFMERAGQFFKFVFRVGL